MVEHLLSEQTIATRSATLNGRESGRFQSTTFLTDKHGVVRDLVRDGSVEFAADLMSVYADVRKGFGEWLALRRDPVYKGEGFPHGDGKKIFEMGGMGSVNVFHYYDLNKSLRALDYDANMFPWTANLAPPRYMGRLLLDHLRKEVKGTGRKAAVIGHSLGSFQWMAAFSEDPEEFASYVDEFYIDESPIPGKLNRAIKAVSLVIPFDKEDIRVLSDGLEAFHEMEESGQLRVTAIESSCDPILTGQTIVSRDEDHYVIEDASHTGGGVNPDFVKLLSYKLAGKEVDFDRVPRVHHAPVAQIAAAA